MGVVELKPFHIGIWHYLVKKTGPQPSFTGQKCASLSTEESSDVLQETSMVRVITKVLLQYRLEQFKNQVNGKIANQAHDVLAQNFQPSL